MAKVNFGTIASDARGKINGIVYSKNKFGSYTRRKVSPANPNTPSQSAVRSSFSALSKAWSGTLTQAERAAWISFAATYPRTDVFGNSIIITGLNMYISLNQRLVQIGAAQISTPPPSNVVTPITFNYSTFAAVASGNNITLSATGGGGTDTNVYVFGHPQLAPGRIPTMSKFRYIYTNPTPGTFPTNMQFGTAYKAKFGSWSAGQNIACLVASIDNTSGLVTVGTVVQAIST